MGTSWWVLGGTHRESRRWPHHSGRLTDYRKPTTHRDSHVGRRPGGKSRPQVQAVQPTTTRRRLTIGPPPQLEKPAHPRKVFADRLLCRSFTFLQADRESVASRPGLLGLIPSGTQNPSSRCFPRLGRSAAYCATSWFRARPAASSPKLARACGTTDWAKFTTPRDQRSATTGARGQQHDRRAEGRGGRADGPVPADLDVVAGEPFSGAHGLRLIPSYTLTDDFDKDFGVDEWHGAERLHP